MKRILFVHSVSEIGGAERMSHTLMDGLDSTQFEPLLSCPVIGPFTNLIEKLGFKVLLEKQIQPSARNPLRTLKSAIHWRNVLTRNAIDIIHTADPYCTRAISIGAWLAGVKVVCHFHFPFEMESLTWLFKRLPTPTVFAFCSEELKRSTGDAISKILPSVRQVVIHNGINLNKFIPQHITNKRPRIGIIANLQERKGHEDFIYMAKIVTNNGVEADYEIIGGDILGQPRMPKLKSLAKELGLSSQIHFHGQVSDIAPLLASLDIAVCASHQEAFPVSILEAMAMAKPIVATDVNGIPEAIEHNISGLLVPPHSPDNLAAAILDLLNEPEKMATLGGNARHRVTTHFSTKNYLDQFQSIYRDVLNQ